MARNETTETDSDALGRAVSWSREAFQLAYRDHSGAVYAAARGSCGSRVAGDVTVEVFLHLWRHPEHQESARNSLRTSLLTVTHDVSLDTIRTETTERASEPRTAARSVADLEDADQALHSADEPSLVALKILSPDERDAIVTAYYGGCTYREAAIVLGLDEGTVTSRIRAGLHRLRGALARASSFAPRDSDGDDHHKASVSDEGFGEALDSRQVVAQAQGIIMERDGSSAGEAYRALSQRSDQLGVSLPVCAEDVVSSANAAVANAHAVDR